MYSGFRKQPQPLKGHYQKAILFAIDPKNGKIEACYGTRKTLKEIADDCRSVKNDSAIFFHLPEDTDACLLEGVLNASNDCLGMRKLLEELLKFGARHHGEILPALELSRRYWRRMRNWRPPSPK